MGLRIHKKYDIPDMDKRLKFFSLKEVESLVEKAIRIFHFHLPFWDDFAVYYSYQSTNHESVAAFVDNSIHRNGFPTIILRLNVLDELMDQEKGRMTMYQKMMRTGKLARFIIMTSVYHELAHAVAMIDNMYEFVRDEDVLDIETENAEEAYCEKFAVDFFKGENVPSDMKQLYKIYHKHWKNGTIDKYLRR